jgi:hypothetical protein
VTITYLDAFGASQTELVTLAGAAVGAATN